MRSAHCSAGGKSTSPAHWALRSRIDCIQPLSIDMLKKSTAEGIRLGDAEGQESHHPTHQREPGQAKDEARRWVDGRRVHRGRFRLG